MSVNNGEKGNALNFNSSFISREVDSSTIGKIDLDNAGSATVTDAQQVINDNIANVAQNAADIVSNDGDITALQSGKEDIANKDQINGYAGLDGSGLLNAAQMPINFFDFQGDWNASTNTPAISDAGGAQNEAYRVSVSGSQNLGSGVIAFEAGDMIIHNGTLWQNGDGVQVSSVNSQSGVVVLDTDDISEGITNKYYTDVKVDTRIGLADVEDLNNVGAAAPADGQVLRWVVGNSRYEPQDPPGAGTVILITAQSSIKTPLASAQFHLHTGNSLSLLANKKYRLFGMVLFNSSGGSAGYSACIGMWKSANGADNGTNPAQLSAAVGLTILSVTDVNSQVYVTTSAVSQQIFTVQEVIVETTSAVTIYLDTYAGLATAGNARIDVYANAEEL